MVKEEKMIKVYGMPTCPYCDYVHEQIKGGQRGENWRIWRLHEGRTTERRTCNNLHGHEEQRVRK